MPDIIKVGTTELHLTRDDITALDIESFVFYARPDLKLGSGFGTAVGVRGGPSIQEELNTLGPRQVTEVVSTKGGELKARLIIHAIGPVFQEPEMNSKLRLTVWNALQEADRQGVREIAFPAMGAGFYGVPLDVCADTMLEAIQSYLRVGKTQLTKVVISVLDNRELKPFRDRFDTATVEQRRR